MCQGLQSLGAEVADMQLPELDDIELESAAGDEGRDDGTATEGEQGPAPGKDRGADSGS
jgi:hypothetical protein